MTDRSSRRMSLLRLGILTAVLHQAIALWLFLYAMSQLESGPLDIFGYTFYVLCWPFALVAHKLYHYRTLVFASWFFGSLFWAAVICLVYGLYRSKRFPCVRE